MQAVQAMPLEERWKLHDQMMQTRLEWQQKRRQSTAALHAALDDTQKQQAGRLLGYGSW